MDSSKSWKVEYEYIFQYSLIATVERANQGYNNSFSYEAPTNSFSPHTSQPSLFTILALAPPTSLAIGQNSEWACHLNADR